MKKNNIYLIMSEENLFHPTYIRGIIEGVGKYDQIVGLTIAKDNPAHFRSFVSQQLQLWGVVGFIYIAGMSTIKKIAAGLGVSSYFSTKDICVRYNIPYMESYNVNEKTHVDLLKKKKVDILISSNGQIFREELLSIPKKAAINRHTGLLPKYGGVLPVFWAMYFEESTFGVSVHHMVKKIDQGDILSQVSIPLSKRNSLFKNYRIAFDKSIDVTLDAVERVKKGKIFKKFVPNKKQYFSHPNYAQIKALKRRGYSTFSLRDILNKF